MRLVLVSGAIGRSTYRSPHFVLETKEDYALAKQRIRALRQGPKDGSAESELAGLMQAVRDWETGAGRKPGYPV